MPSAALPLQPELAILEQGSATFAVGRAAITIVHGAERATARAPAGAPWEMAAAIFPPGAEASWVVALAAGALYRVDETGRIAAVGSQLGAAAGPIVAVAGAGRTFAIATRDDVVVATADSLKRFPGGARGVAAARGRVALARADGVDVLDLDRARSTRYPLVAVDLGFLDPFGATPRLVVRTADAVMVEQGGALRALDLGGPVAQLAVAGDRLWLRVAGTLHVLHAGELRPTSIAITSASRIFGSPTGDVWVADGAQVRRYRAAAAIADWSQVIEPIVRRACLPCHAPAGDADIDLSTADRWQRLRPKIYRRTVMERTMPPDVPLADADLATLREWLER